MTLNRKKSIFLAFAIPFILATVGYHCVYVCDASVRGQWMDVSSKIDPTDKAAMDKALEQEENRRWSNGSAWGVHAILLGLPAGLLSLLAFSTGVWGWSKFTRRGKADEPA